MNRAIFSTVRDNLKSQYSQLMKASRLQKQRGEKRQNRRTYFRFGFQFRRDFWFTFDLHFGSVVRGSSLRLQHGEGTNHARRDWHLFLTNFIVRGRRTFVFWAAKTPKFVKIESG